MTLLSFAPSPAFIRRTASPFFSSSPACRPSAPRSFPPPKRPRTHSIPAKAALPSTTSPKPIPVDYATLSHCISALSLLAIPARVDTILQESPTRLVLILRTLTSSHRLTLSFSQTHGRLTLTPSPSSKKKSPQTPYALAATAKSLLQATALTRATIPSPFDRVARLDFASSPAAPPAFHIFLELLGNGRSNLILTDAALSIKACGRQVTARDVARPLQTGLTWVPPPPPRGAAPDDHTLAETLVRIARETPGERLGKVVVRAVAGVSPAVVGALFGTGRGEMLIGDVEEGGFEVVAKELKDWFRKHRQAAAYRVRVREGKGGYGLEGAGTREGENVEERVQEGLTAIERYYFGLEVAEEVARLAKGVRKTLKGRLARAGANVGVFERKLEECDGVEALKRDAEFLFSYAHTWQAGDEKVAGEWVKDGGGREKDDEEEEDQELEEIEVMLPGGNGSDEVSPVEYANKLYKRANKLERAREFAQERLENSRAEVAWLEGMVVALEMARSPEDVVEIDAELEFEKAQSAAAAAASASVSGPLGRKQSDDSSRKRKGKTAGKMRNGVNGKSKASTLSGRSKANSGAASSVGSGILRVPIAADGEATEVLIGRNANGNERLTFDVARRSDLWLHVAGAPGSHVVVRRSEGGGTPIGEDSVQVAANLAAFFSKSSAEANVPVSVLKAADVRRARGSPRRIGSVIMTGNDIRTVNARPDDARRIAIAALEDTVCC